MIQYRTLSVTFPVFDGKLTTSKQGFQVLYSKTEMIKPSLNETLNQDSTAKNRSNDTATDVHRLL